jgi:HK97 family phage portal protein
VIGVAIATQGHAANFWKRDATPSLVLKHPQVLSDGAKKNIQDSWEATYAGQDSRRVAVLEEGMEMQQLSVSAHDAQFLETRKFQRSEIAGWFHVPPHMLGDTEKSTSWGTGIEQQQIAFLTFTIRPWLVAFEQRFNRDFVTNPDRFFVEFNVDGLLRGDIGSRYTAYQKGVLGGWLSPNDVRSLENMNPIDGGDIYLAPMNMAPIDKLPAIADAAAEPAAPSGVPA